MEASKAAEEKARIEREAAEQKQKAEERARKEAEDKATWEAEQQRTKDNEIKTSTPAKKLDQYFNAISGSGNTTNANASINEALRCLLHLKRLY